MKPKKMKRNKIGVSITPFGTAIARKTPYEFTLTVPVENLFWYSAGSSAGPFGGRIRAAEDLTQPKGLGKSAVFMSKIIKF